MDIDSCYELGHVTKIRGIKGEVVVYLDVDSPQDYQDMESVFVETQQGLIPFFIEILRIQAKLATIKFVGVDSIEDAEKLKKRKLYLSLDRLPELGDNQFYYHEIVGYQVIDRELGELGKVVNVFDSGPQKLIAMEYVGKEVLFPIQDDLILEVNKEDRVLHVELPEGLIDVYI